MTMSTALSIADSGLANIDAQFAILSQNVANIGTPGWAAETSTQYSVTAGGIGMGVHTGPARRVTDAALQSLVNLQNTAATGLQTTQSALQALDAAMGTPGQGNDIGSLTGDLQNSFSTLMNDPSNQAQQSAVVSAATTLAQNVNTLSQTYTAQRQAAQDDLAASLSTLNNTLNNIGQITHQIVALQQQGKSSADLENQRDGLLQTLSGLVGVQVNQGQNGSLSIVTSSGLVLPTDGTANFTIANSQVGPTSYYPGGGLSGITLNGKDVTSQLTGGEIGADVTLRDQTLPAGQAALDEFAHGLATRFADQGLALFTDATGTVPQATGGSAQAGYAGFSASIQVNAAVTADPALVRDGTDAIAGSVAGASAFTPNPSGGPAGFSGLITRVLNYTFTDQIQASVSQPALSTTGLGPGGTLSANMTGGGSLLGFATGIVSAQAQQSAAASNDLATTKSLQSSLSAKLSAETGVNIDTEMSRMLALQNAYSANARVVSAIQTMFNQLLQAVQ